MYLAQDYQFMKTALELAEQGRLTVSPNPMVGCVLVKNQQMIGKGFHIKAGDLHAERYALNSTNTSTHDATAYVTLEPCVHHGRTPPCTEALIQSGIKKIFIATLDPNPLVAGKGAAALQSAGIEVNIGLCQEEAISLNEIFFHYITHKRPFVTLKWAMSLDGKTVTHQDDLKQISGSEAQLHTHRLRQQMDAILIGANTLRIDNPRLTVRLTEFEESQLNHPIRIILAGNKTLSTQCSIFDACMPGKTIIATTQKNQKQFSSLGEILILPENKEGYPDIPSLLCELGKQGITSLLVEGGMTIHQQFIKQGLFNKIHTYVTPVFIGNLMQKQTIQNVICQTLGNDYHFSMIPI